MAVVIRSKQKGPGEPGAGAGAVRETDARRACRPRLARTCVTAPPARPALPADFMALLGAICKDIMAPRRHPQSLSSSQWREMVRHQNCNEEMRSWVLFSASVLHPVSSARTKRVHLFAGDRRGRVQSLRRCQKFKIQLCLLLGRWRRRRIRSPANAEQARGTCEQALFGGGL